MPSSRSRNRGGPSASRPYVVCHMVPSVDGGSSPRLAPAAAAPGEYERTASTFDADAWIIGRVSMEPYAGHAVLPARRAAHPASRLRRSLGRPVVRDRDRSQREAPLGIRLGRRGARGHRPHRAGLRSLPGVPPRKGSLVPVRREERIELPKVLRKLRARFGIRKLLLEGGGKINGSFLAAGAIDELSLLIAPVADGAIGTPSLFDARKDSGPARHLKLLSVERRRGDLLWVRYRVRGMR